MRVLLLTDDYPPQRGGVSTWTRAAAQALGSHHEVRVIARARRDRRIDPWLIEAKGRSFGAWGGVWTAAAAWRLRNWADLVVACTWPVATTAAPWLSTFGPPLHTVFHGSELTRPPSRAGFTRVVEASARCFAVSEFLVSTAARRGVNATWLPCPLALEEVNEGGDRWVMVARAVSSKGGERFIRLVAAAEREGDIVGDGPELTRWKRLAARLGARVAFHGALGPDQVDRVLGRAALVALLSRSENGAGAEGLGLALMEARARGIAVVGCRTGGVVEALGPGLVLEDPDDAVASAQAIEAWWTRQRGLEGREDYRNTHGPERFVAALTCPRPSEERRDGLPRLHDPPA